MAIIVPLEQAALVVVVWPWYRAHRFDRLGTAISAGALAAAGYGIVSSVVVAATATSAWVVTRLVATFITRVFCTAIWASCLASSHARYRHFFPLAWLVGSRCSTGSCVTSGRARSPVGK